MVRLGCGLLVLLIALPSAGQTVSPEPTKPAWEWSLDERIAKRLDPVSIMERAQANERELNLSPEELTYLGLSTPPKVRFTVDGKRDPELLMPFELFDSILHGVRDGGESTRSTYHKAITESGWEEQEFWRTLEISTVEYRRATDARLVIERKARTLEGAEKRSLTAQAESDGVRECGLRADALQSTRSKLGIEKFNRFLYERVAPNVGIGSDFPLNNEEWRLRFIEAGCR